MKSTAVLRMYQYKKRGLAPPEGGPFELRYQDEHTASTVFCIIYKLLTTVSTLCLLRMWK